MRDDEESFSLGEGSTPLIPLNKIGKRLGLEKLFAKLEFMSPTGSFKDRGSSLVINIARKERVEEFVEDSPEEIELEIPPPVTENDDVELVDLD